MKKRRNMKDINNQRQNISGRTYEDSIGDQEKEGVRKFH